MAVYGDGSARLMGRTTQACAVSVAALNAMAFAGWATRQPVLLGLRTSHIPMPPNSALAFLALGLGLWAIEAG